MKEILSHYTILYAEDDLVLQGHTKEYLQRFFKKVYIANDGNEAMTKYRSYTPDVLLLDIDMPHIDGLSLVKEIRQHNKTIPILMLTAFTDVDKLLKATELNLCKYLVKPLNATVFKEALSTLCDVLHADKTTVLLKEGYCWNTKHEVLSCDKSPIELTSKEQILLKLLLKHHHHCVSFEEIMAMVWEDDFDAEISIDAIKYHVSQLRKKLPSKSIKSVYAKGFMFN